MAQESRVQNAIQELERLFGKITRSISGAELAACISGWHTWRPPLMPDTRAGLSLEAARPSWRGLEAATSEQAAGTGCKCRLNITTPRYSMLPAGLRLDVDAERAEEQELEQGGLADTLKEIVGRTIPSPRYVRFHEAHVQRYLSRLKAFPPRCGRCLTLLIVRCPCPFRPSVHVTTCLAAIAVLIAHGASLWEFCPCRHQHKDCL